MIRTVVLRGLAPASFYLVAFAVLTWPALLSFSTHFLCDAGDGLQNVWNLWWIHTAVGELRNPWFTDRLYHPDGVTLIGATLNAFNGFAALPLWSVFELHELHNVIVVFTFVMTGLTTFWLALYSTGSYGGSLFAGAAFTFSSYHFIHAYGHLQLLSIEWLPLFLLAWLALLDAPSVRRGIGAAVALLLVMTCAYEYAFYCVMAGGLLLLHRAWHHRRTPRHWLRWPRLGPLLAFAATALVLLGPFAAALVWVDRNDPWVGVHESDRFVLDLLGPWIPGAHWRFAEWTEWFWGAREEGSSFTLVSGNPIDGTAYLRYSLLLPALAAVWLRRRWSLRDTGAWLSIAIVFGALACGPVLRCFGEPLVTGYMPYQLLEAVFPPLRMSGMPVRMMAMVMLAISLLAASALSRLWIAASWPWRIVWLALFVFETLPFELPRTRPPIPDHVARLAELPAGAVGGLKGEPVDLYHQTVFDKPIVAGYVARVPGSLADRGRVQEQMLAEGRHLELLQRFDLRYLVLYKFDPHREGLAGLRVVYAGASHDLWVRDEDPLPPYVIPARDCGSGAEVGVRIETAPGSALPIALHLDAPADAGRRFHVGFSLATDPGIPLADGRSIPLAADPLFDLAAQPDNPVFVGNQGRLDGAGHAVVALRVDTPELRGRTVYFCVGIYDPDAPLELCRLSGRGSFVVP